MSELRILVADDHDVVRHGLRALLEGQTGWRVVGEAIDGYQAVSMTKSLKPDVVILDVTMPKLNGLEVTRQVLKAHRRTEILVLTMHESDELVRGVFEAGARGYVLKSDAARDLVTAVQTVSQHKPFLTPRVAEVVLHGYLEGTGEKKTPASFVRLSPRQREIVQLFAEGKTTKEAAALLNISVKTAETHRANIMRQLRIHSVSELVRYAIRNKIIEA